MPSAAGICAPGLATFSRSVRNRGTPIESSAEHLVSLLKRRQIRNSWPCALATAQLLCRVVETLKFTNASKLIERIQKVGEQLMLAQPRELAIGNTVRRVLGVIRLETEEDREGETSVYGDVSKNSGAQIPNHQELWTFDFTNFSSPPSAPGDLEDGISKQLTAEQQQKSSHLTSDTSYAFKILHDPQSHALPPPSSSILQSFSGSPVIPAQASLKTTTSKELKSEIIESIQEIIEEIKQADDQIAGYSLEHIHSNELILTHTSSSTVQTFLLKAAAKRKFTVIYTEAYPNGHEGTHAMNVGIMKSESSEDVSMENFQKTLTAAGITVIIVPDSAVFALMSRVNKVILSTHVVLADGGLIAPAGARTIAKAAKLHCTPIVVLSAVYQLSPVYPFDLASLMENGDPSRVISYADTYLMDKVNIENPLFDYVPVDLIDLYITNLGAHAPSYLHSIINDHYRAEDLE